MTIWKKAFGTAVLTGLIAGCASAPTGNYQYDDANSHAWNIATAGGIYGIQDTVVAEEHRVHFTRTGAYTGLSIAAAIGSPIMGGLSILSDSFSARNQNARPAIVAWMPVELANDPDHAVSVLESLLVDATKDALDKLGATYFHLGRDAQKENFHFFREDWDCPMRDPDAPSRYDFGCHISIGGSENRPPIISHSPVQFIESPSDAYFFQSSHKVFYPRLEIRGLAKGNVPTMEIYSAISALVPDWAFFYIPAGGAKDAEGQRAEYPIVMSQGQAYFFITP